MVFNIIQDCTITFGYRRGAFLPVGLFTTLLVSPSRLTLRWLEVLSVKYMTSLTVRFHI